MVIDSVKEIMEYLKRIVCILDNWISRIPTFRDIYKYDMSFMPHDSTCICFMFFAVLDKFNVP